jgi:hypothetical protein
VHLADAVRLRPLGVSEADWRDLLLAQSTQRCLEQPEAPASWHLAVVHENLLDGYYAELGESRPPAYCQRALGEVGPTPGIVLAWRYGWLLVAAIVFKSWGLLLFGALVLFLEPRRCSNP